MIKVRNCGAGNWNWVTVSRRLWGRELGDGQQKVVEQFHTTYNVRNNEVTVLMAA
jgi:hypothetical protein